MNNRQGECCFQDQEHHEDFLRVSGAISDVLGQVASEVEVTTVIDALLDQIAVCLIKMCPSCRKTAARLIKQDIPNLLKAANEYVEEQERQPPSSTSCH